MALGKFAPRVTDHIVDLLFFCTAMLGVVTSVPGVTVGSMWGAFVSYSLMGRLCEAVVVVAVLLWPVQMETTGARQRLLTVLQEMQLGQNGPGSFATARDGASVNQGQGQGQGQEQGQALGQGLELELEEASEDRIGAPANDSSAHTLLAPSPSQQQQQQQQKTSPWSPASWAAQARSPASWSGQATPSPSAMRSPLQHTPSPQRSSPAAASTTAAYSPLSRLGAPLSAPNDVDTWKHAWEGADPKLVCNQPADAAAASFSSSSPSNDASTSSTSTSQATSILKTHANKI